MYRGIIMLLMISLLFKADTTDVLTHWPLNQYDVSLTGDIDLWSIAYAYWYFEQIILASPSLNWASFLQVSVSDCIKLTLHQIWDSQNNFTQ